ncbi:MAG: hypothetical protein WBW13_27245, partial [Pseudolabrys sp.]
MIAYTAKVLHQPIKFVESWPAVSLCAFSNKSEFLKDSDGVVEFLPGERISPCRPGNREDVGEMGKIIAAGLRLDILSELFCERHQGLAGNVAAFELAEVTGLDRPKNLGFRPQNHVFGLDNVAVDGRRQRWIFPAFQPTRLFEFGFALDDPGICRLFAVERFGLTVDDCTAFFYDDLGRKSLGAVFASPSYNRSHGTTRLPKVRHGRTTDGKMMANRPETVRHETRVK